MAQEVQAKSKFIDMMAYSMFAPNGKQSARARFSWGILGDTVRMTVFTNVPEDTTNRGMINATLGHVEFTIFIAKFNAIASGPNGASDKIESLIPVRGDDNKITDQRIMGTLHFGKSDDGMVWIAIKDEGRPDIRFIFEPNRYTHFFTNGQLCSPQENSILYAKGRMSSLKTTVDAIVAQQIQNKEPRQQGGQAPAQAGATPKTPGGYDEEISF